MLDVVIIGGGPAGLSAALLLGRSRRRVLVIDADKPRNANSKGVTGFLSRDGIAPGELRHVSREQLASYPSVRLRTGEVSEARSTGSHFEIVVAGETIAARKLLLATGLVDDAPAIEGAREFYGRGVYNCPYCDGWEARDQPFAVYGRGHGVVAFARELLVWSRDLIVCTDGPCAISEDDRETLAAFGVVVTEEPIARLAGGSDGLEEIVFSSGRRLARKHLFFTLPECKQSPLVEQLGIDTTSKGAVATGHCEKTNIAGCYVAGDASRRVHFAIVAAAEGAMAAFAINAELVEEGVEPERL